MKALLVRLCGHQREINRVRTRMLRTLFAATPRGASGLSALMALEAILPSVVAVATGVLIGAAGRLGETTGAARVAAVRTPFLVFAAVLLLTRVLAPCGVVARSFVERRVDAWVRDTVLGMLARSAATEPLEDEQVAAKVSLVLGGQFGVYTLGSMAIGQLSLFFRFATAGVAALLIARVSPALALALVATALVVRFGFRLKQQGFVEIQQFAVETFRRAGYFGDLCQNPTAAKEVRIFELGRWLSDRYAHSWDAAAKPLRRVVLKFIPKDGPWILLAGAVQAAVYARFGYSAAVGAISVGLMTAALTASRSLEQVHDTGDDHRRQVYGAMAFDALDMLDARTTPRAAASPARPVDGLPAREIRFSGVSYTYPSGAQATSGLDLVLEAGRSTAIVGPNGAGKTTFVKLLAGLAEAQAGEILVDGIPLDTLDADAWRSRLAVIFQDFTRFELSFADNMCLAETARRPSVGQLERALDRAGARDVLDTLPASWDTILSREFEGGVELSGGQWQRVALARAFCAVETGARVLVLDEPTAALDVKAEAELFDRFLDLTHGLTTVLISHRFSTVRHAERIVVLDGGRAVETGSHDELMRRGGLYARMFRIQAERFGVE